MYNKAKVIEPPLMTRLHKFAHCEFAAIYRRQHHTDYIITHSNNKGKSNGNLFFSRKTKVSHIGFDWETAVMIFFGLLSLVKISRNLQGKCNFNFDLKKKGTEIIASHSNTFDFQCVENNVTVSRRFTKFAVEHCTTTSCDYYWSSSKWPNRLQLIEIVWHDLSPDIGGK